MRSAFLPLIATLLAVPASGFARVAGGSSAGNPAVAAQRGAADAPVVPRSAASAASVGAGRSPASIPGSPASGEPFSIAAVVFEGTTRVPDGQLAALARPFEHRRVSLAELRQLTDAVQARYRARGYFLARALLPAQRLDGGNLRILVAEGRFGSTRIEGNRHYSGAFIERFFAPARRGGVLQEGPLTRALLIENEFPDLRVQSVLASGAAPGTADVLLRVQDQRPLHLALDYNNHGNVLVGRNRAGATLTAGNLALEGDSMDLRVAVPFPSESDPFYQANYSAPVGDLGARMGYQFLQAKTRVSGNLAALDLRGDAQIHALVWTRPLSRSLVRSSNFTAAFLAKTIQTFVLGDTLVSRDDLRELSFAYSGLMVDRKGRWYHSSSMMQGLGTALGGNRNGDPLASRVDAGNQFTRLNTDWVRYLKLTPRDALLLRAGAQWTADPLITAELFGIGGPDSVRGFIQSEFLGDRGLTLGAEYNRTARHTRDWRLVLAAFVDRGEASLITPAAGQRASQHLAGAGGGLRVQYRSHTALKLDFYSQGWVTWPPAALRPGSMLARVICSAKVSDGLGCRSASDAAHIRSASDKLR